jgi:hypothetical protein
MLAAVPIVWTFVDHATLHRGGCMSIWKSAGVPAVLPFRISAEFHAVRPAKTALRTLRFRVSTLAC